MGYRDGIFQDHGRRRRTYRRRDPVTNFFDLETEGLGGRAILAVWTEGDTIKHSRKLTDLISAMERIGGVWIAHNASYDFMIMAPTLWKIGYSAKINAIKGKYNTVRLIKNSKTVCYIKDSYKLIPLSLKDAAKLFAPEYQKLERPENWSPKTRKEWKILTEYAVRDVVALREVWKNFREAIKNTLKVDVASTLPGTAFKSLKEFTNQFEKIPELCRNHREFVRQAYHGGMVWSKTGTYEQAYKYDVNSMYPWAMSQPIPVGKPFHFTVPRCVENVYRRGDPGFLKCKVRIPPMNIPGPLAYKTENKLCYPTDAVIEGIWTTEELRYAESRGCEILEFQESLVFLSAEPLLKEWVERYYKLKSESEEPYRSVAKLLLNSAYGRFGLSEESEIIEINPQREIPDDTAVFAENGFLITSRKQSTAHASHLVQVAAWITALARIKLHQDIKETTIYVDTDCIIDTTERDDLEVDNKKLGAYKYEGTLVDLAIAGKKIYSTPGTTKTKGVPHGLLTHDQIKELAEGKIEELRAVWTGVKRTPKESYSLPATEMTRTIKRDPSTPITGTILEKITELQKLREEAGWKRQDPETYRQLQQKIRSLKGWMAETLGPGWS